MSSGWPVLCSPGSCLLKMFFAYCPFGSGLPIRMRNRCSRFICVGSTAGRLYCRPAGGLLPGRFSHRTLRIETPDPAGTCAGEPSAVPCHLWSSRWDGADSGVGFTRMNCFPDGSTIPALPAWMFNMITVDIASKTCKYRYYPVAIRGFQYAEYCLVVFYQGSHDLKATGAGSG